MYLYNVKLWLFVKIKITVYNKQFIFWDSCLTHSFVWIKVCQILVKLNAMNPHEIWNVSILLKKDW